MLPIPSLLLSCLMIVPWFPPQNELQPIFNGKDLSGWREPDGNIWFRAEDGLLRVASGAQKRGAILWTDRTYSDFVLDLEFRFGRGLDAGDMDSGVFLRRDSEQIQIGISRSLKRDMTGSPYISGKGYPVEAQGVDKLLKLNDWNEMRIEARGPTYQVWLNGQQVLNYRSRTAADKGPIGLQLHGGCTMAIDYRNVRAADLADASEAGN